jgi:hypothetical protein
MSYLNNNRSLKLINLILISIIVLGCVSKVPNVTKSKLSKLRKIKTEYVKFKDYKNRIIDPCDTFSIEVEDIYPEITKIGLAFEDTAFLDNFLKLNGFKTTHSGCGNFPDGPRIFELELSNGECNCKVYKKYILQQIIGENGIVRHKYKLNEKIICNALNNAVE